MIGLHMSRKQCQCPFTSFNFGDFAFENVTSFECQIRIVDDKIKKAKREDNKRSPTQELTNKLKASQKTV